MQEKETAHWQAICHSSVGKRVTRALGI
ncbi:hypothetical protein RHIZ404_210165 [Rhizobium sp. EC-SD404]|nr:hypothetical protein RHIZ404_210165 [Rhizobium sp. EC-SD404]